LKKGKEGREREKNETVRKEKREGVEREDNRQR